MTNHQSSHKTKLKYPRQTHYKIISKRVDKILHKIKQPKKLKNFIRKRKIKPNEIKFETQVKHLSNELCKKREKKGEEIRRNRSLSHFKTSNSSSFQKTVKIFFIEKKKNSTLILVLVTIERHMQ